MVLPLLPIIAGGALLGGGGLAGWKLGKGGAPSKKETISTSIIEAAPYQHYAPQVQFAPVTTYGYQGATTIIGSPGAESKKEQVMDVVSKPEQWGAWDFPVSVAQEPKDVSGTNMSHIAIIGVIGLVVYMVLKKKK